MINLEYGVVIFILSAAVWAIIYLTSGAIEAENKHDDEVGGDN